MVLVEDILWYIILALEECAYGVDIYDIDANNESRSTLTGGVTIYYGGRDGKGKRVDMVCESQKYHFSFNVRNKQGGQFPSHVMCDYTKK